MTHEERLTLIHKPFPMIGGGRVIQPKTWAGTIVADSFFGGRERPASAKKTDRLQISGEDFAGHVYTTE